METRWHFKPGQTLRNSTSCERKLELHIAAKEWNQITEKLGKGKLKAEAIAKERDRRQRMKEENEAMVDKWEDSLLNLYRRREKERLERLQQKETDRVQHFLVLRKEQEQLREEFIKEMQQAAYRETGYPRNLNSALLLSEVYYEREKQKEFGEMLKRKKKEQEKEYAEKVKRDAKEELKEKEEEKRKVMEQKQNLKEFYYKQMREAEEKAEEEKRQKLGVDAVDNIKAVEDMQRIERIIKAREDEQKREQREFTLKNLKECEERKRLQKADEMDKDLLIAIQDAAKCRLEMLKKQHKEELEKQVVARRIAIGSKVAAAAKEFADHERMVMEKAQAELERKEVEKVRAEAEKARKMKEDNMRSYKLAMEEEQKKKEFEAEVKKWETMNRYKIGEVTKEFIQQERQKEWEKKLQYRAALKAQIAENEAFEKHEKEEDTNWHRKKICSEEENEKFYGYAEEVLNSAKEKGRLTYPIERVIQKYKKENTVALPSFCRKNSKVVVPDNPGKMALDPKTDPNYNKCRNNVESLYSDI